MTVRREVKKTSAGYISAYQLNEKNSIPLLKKVVVASGSKVAIGGRAKVLGIKFESHCWTEEEINILKKYYPTEGIKVIRRLPNRNNISSSALCRVIKSHNLNIKSETGKIHCKKIICVDTGEIFNSSKEACEKYNIGSGSICACLKGKYSYAGKLPDGTKLHWKYIEEEKEN